MITKLELDAKFLGTLASVLWAQSPPHLLNGPHRCLEGGTSIPCCHWSLKFDLAKLCYFDHVIRDCMGISTRVIWWMSEPPGIDSRRLKQWSGTGNLFSRCFRMTNWSEPTGGISKCGDNVLFVLEWNFAILTTLYGDPEVYTCMTSWMESSPCFSIGHMLKERTFWNFLCYVSYHTLTCVVCVCADQVSGDFGRLSRTWLLSLVLWMLYRCQEERNCSL